MIDTIIKNLERGQYLLENISDKKYSDKSIAPYYSSIGGHFRHVLDVYSCIFKGLDLDEEINLTLRERNVKAENYTVHGLEYLSDITNKLRKLDNGLLSKPVKLVDDLGDGCCTVNTTLESVLVQAHSHAIHHFATIGYMMHVLKIHLPMDSFGINPTTPQAKMAIADK
ncbi:DinB family protein [Wenyingzhuangia sp. IMCC45533]